MMEVMEIDEAHAIDHRSCVRVLIMRCDTGFTVLDPAYQNPDRRGRAEDTRGYRDDQGWKGLTILSFSPFEQEFLLRGVAPKSREFTSNK